PHSSLLIVFLSLLRPPPRSPLFPYTTLFRSLYRYSDDRTDRRSETPVDEHNHALAALRYLVSAIDARQMARMKGKCAASENAARSEEHTSELQSLTNLVCRLLLEKKKDILTD